MRVSSIRFIRRGLIATLLLVTALTGGRAIARDAAELDHDISQPIEFSADRLEVEEKNRVATFEGNVKAVQGELRLLADIVRVYFRGPGGNAGDQPEVDRIDATGNVTLLSPDETAQGDWGIYDVDNKIITLGGAVVLTRETTVIEGTRLVLDLELGRSRIESIATATGEEQRVRGVFQPARPGDQDEK
ncbi:MAG: LptA/OstA family protein [Sphingomonadales bacterium]